MSRVPAVGQLAALHAQQLVGELRVLAAGSASKSSIHASRSARAALADAGREVLAHAVGDEELRVLGPAVGALGEPHLLLAERLAVRRARALLGRRRRRRCGCRR